MGGCVQRFSRYLTVHLGRVPSRKPTSTSLLRIALELLVPRTQVVKGHECLVDLSGDVAGVAAPFAFALADVADDGFHAV
jgi:hypothetical protein